MSATWGVGPYDNDAAHAYLAELSLAVPAGFELLPVLDGEGTADLDFAQEQYALAELVAEAIAPTVPPRMPAAAASLVERLQGDRYLATLANSGCACLNRLLNDPYSALWQGHDDGGLAIRRRVRALRARLHRASASPLPQ